MDAKRRQVRVPPDVAEAIRERRQGRKLREAAALYALLGGRLLETQEGRGQLLAKMEDEGIPNKRGAGRLRITDGESAPLEIAMLPALLDLIESAKRDLGEESEAVILRTLIRAGLESGESLAAVSGALLF